MKYHKASPCPDCGGRVRFTKGSMTVWLAHIGIDFPAWYAVCRKCGHRFPIGAYNPACPASVQMATRMWNRMMNGSTPC